MHFKVNCAIIAALVIAIVSVVGVNVHAQTLQSRVPPPSAAAQAAIDDLMSRDVRMCVKIETEPVPQVRQSRSDRQFDTFTTLYARNGKQRVTLNLRGPLTRQPAKGKSYFLTTLRPLDGEGYYYLVDVESVPRGCEK
ncbi:MAG: hypothetical protein V4486_02985 [Patescibacteria group bacterium]